MPADPPNAFAAEFRRRLAEQDEPATSHEAYTAGSAQVVPMADGFAVLPEGERLDEGDRPAAVLVERAEALLAAAALPASGREPVYQLDRDAGEHGYAIRSGGRVVGYLSRFDESWLAALNAFGSLVRSPPALALVLEASGGLALERVGRLLEQHTRPRRSAPDEDAD